MDIVGEYPGLVLVGSSLECDAAVRRHSSQTRFCELLQQSSSTATNNNAATNLPLRFCDVTSLYTPRSTEVSSLLWTALNSAPVRKGTPSRHGRLSIPSFDALFEQLRAVPNPVGGGFQDQPLCFVFAALVSEAEAVGSLSTVAEGIYSTMPDSYRQGILDTSEAARLYVLVRETGDSDELVARVLSSARSTFGAGLVYTLEIETRSNGGAGAYLASVPSPVEQLVAELSQQVVLPHVRYRVEALNAIVEKARKGVRNTIRSLFRTADAKSPGIIHPKGQQGAPQFLFSSIESQMHLLADFLVLLQDYPAALTLYRLVASDYKQLRAYVQHGAAMEMVSHCVLHGGCGSRREGADALRNAIESYTRSEAWIPMIRSTCRLIYVCHSASAPEAAGTAALRAVPALPRITSQLASTGESNDAAGGSVSTRETSDETIYTITKAVLLEMTSVSFQLVQPVPKHRKSKVYSYFAAENYSATGLHRHALRCFQSCLGHIDGEGWNALEDNLLWCLAQEELRLGNVIGAYAHLARLMKASASSPTVQLRIVNELFATIRKSMETQLKEVSGSDRDVHARTGGKNNIREMERRRGHHSKLPPLSYPSFLAESAFLTTNDHPLVRPEFLEPLDEREEPPTDKYGDPVVTWRHLEDEVLKRSIEAHGHQTFLTLRPPSEESLLQKRQRHRLPGSCVAGETVYLNLSLSNPMRVAIYLLEVVAVASLELPPGAAEKVSSDSSPILPASYNSSEIAEGDLVEITPLRNLLLQALATVDIRLALRPKVPGILRVTGVSWKFSNEANGEILCCGEQPLIRRGKRMNLTKSQRQSPNPVYEDDVTLRMEVIEAIPRLEPQLKLGNNLLDTNGEASLTLRESEMKRADLVLSIREVSDRNVVATSVLWTCPDAIFMDQEHEHFSQILGLGSEKQIPVYLRGSTFRGPGRGSAGKQFSLRGIICYWCVLNTESAGGSRLVPQDEAPPRTRDSALYVRFERVHLSAYVNPSMIAFPRFLRHRVVDDRREYLLGIETERSDSATSDQIRIERIELISYGVWWICGLSPPTLVQSESVSEQTNLDFVQLSVNETATVFCRMRATMETGAVTSGRPTGRNRASIGISSGNGVTSQEWIQTEVQDSFRGRVSSHFLAEELKRGTVTNYPEYSSDVVKVIVHWKEQVTAAEGEIYLPPMVPSEWIDEEENGGSKMEKAARTSSPETSRFLSESNLKPCLVMKSVHREKIFRPTEEVDKPAVVPVDVIVTNVGSSSKRLDALFTALPSSVADHSRGRYWSGQVQTTLRNLAPGQQRRIRLSAFLALQNMTRTFNLSELSLLPCSDAQSLSQAGESSFSSIKPSSLTVVDALNPAFALSETAQNDASEVVSEPTARERNTLNNLDLIETETVESSAESSHDVQTMPQT